MKHTNEQNVKCPYCDSENEDSWELSEDSGTCFCGNCHKEFNYTRELTAVYHSSRINCEESNGKHNYQYDLSFESKRKHENGKWIDLSEKDYLYKRKIICSICGDEEYMAITKEQYNQDLIKL